MAYSYLASTWHPCHSWVSRCTRVWLSRASCLDNIPWPIRNLSWPVRGVGAVAAGPAMAAPLLAEDGKIKTVSKCQTRREKWSKLRPPRSKSCAVQYITVLAFDMYVLLQKAYCSRLCVWLRVWQCKQRSIQCTYLRAWISGSEVTSYSAIMYMYMYMIVHCTVRVHGS